MIFFLCAVYLFFQGGGGQIPEYQLNDNSSFGPFLEGYLIMLRKITVNVCMYNAFLSEAWVNVLEIMHA